MQACLPDVNDSAQTLGAHLKGTDISEARLVEAAMYSPEWIDIVGDYLGWDGFTAGCYYFMAHMNESFDNKRTAMIARYTPLSVEELNDGAFDRAWFTEVYEKLGEKHFTLIYKAAKYISDGAKHARARKYADAALGKYNETELLGEIEAKRNKDLLMAVGILPIADETQIKERYMFLQTVWCPAESQRGGCRADCITEYGNQCRLSGCDETDPTDGESGGTGHGGLFQAA